MPDMPLPDAPLPITALILTYNEERHIARCLDNLAGLVARVVVVDSFSTDRTVQIARAHGADVLQNPWTGYATQFQWGLDHAGIATGWTLRIDADETLDPVLKAAMRAWFAAPAPQVNALYLRRQIVFLGRPIRHGFFHAARMLRLWRTGQGRIEQRRMDEHVLVRDPVAETLPGALTDHNLNDLGWWIAKHNAYATREVCDMVEILERRRQGGGQSGGQSGGQGACQDRMSGQAARKRWLKEQVYARLPATLRASLYFLYRYVLGCGFLDGKAGFYFHFLQAWWYRTLVEAKLYELQQRAAAAGLTPHVLLRQEGLIAGPDIAGPDSARPDATEEIRPETAQAAPPRMARSQPGPAERGDAAETGLPGAGLVA